MEFQKQAKCDKWEPYQEILSRNPRMERIVRQISFPTNDAAAVTSVCVLAPALGSFTQWLLRGGADRRQGAAVLSGAGRLPDVPGRRDFL